MRDFLSDMLEELRQTVTVCGLPINALNEFEEYRLRVTNTSAAPPQMGGANLAGSHNNFPEMKIAYFISDGFAIILLSEATNLACPCTSLPLTGR